MKTLNTRHKVVGLGLAALLAVAAFTPQQAKAGDQEWAVVGKVLTGITAAHLLFNILPGRTRHHREAVQAPVRRVVRPAPVRRVTYVVPAPPPRPVRVAPYKRVYHPRKSRFAYVQVRNSIHEHWVTIETLPAY
jgi:hypothetical protein